MRDSGYPAATFGGVGSGKTPTTRDEMFEPGEATLGYVETDPETWVDGGYHYTGLGSNEAFEELLARHDLTYIGTLDHGDEETRYVWARDDKTTPVFMSVSANPLAGEHPVHDDVDPGHLGIVTVGGEYAFAKPLWDDIAETCVYNKGVSRPLADEEIATDDIPSEHWPKVNADHPDYPEGEY